MEKSPSALEPPHSAKHQQMLEAAGELFITQGYGKVSMEAVAKLAQVSKATLYAHFPSKDVLFATIVGDACARNALGDNNFPELVGDIGAALRQIGTRLLSFLMLDRTMAIYRVTIAESARFPELGAAFLAAGPLVFVDRMAGWLEQQSLAGHLTIAEPTIAAEQFLALLRTTSFLRATLKLPASVKPEDSVPAIVEAAVTIFLRGYGAAQENQIS
jgi:TetR/AcrR family transcriptional repressor of mexJK operon